MNKGSEFVTVAQLRSELERVGGSVRDAVDEVVGALLANDRSRMYAVMLADLPINRTVRRINTMSARLLHQHQCTELEARWMGSILRLGVALERIGDYAVTIARVGVRLEHHPSKELMQGLTTLAIHACHMLQDAMQSYIDGDRQLAQRTIARARSIDSRHAGLFEFLLSRQDSDLSPSDIHGWMTIIAQLERVSDQAKNLCEEALFVVTGETKPPKRYEVWFVESVHAVWAPVAEGIARTGHPAAGVYRSMGLTTLKRFPPHLSRVGRELALDWEHLQPMSLDTALHTQPVPHVVVCLEDDQALQLPPLPFRTIVLRWTIDAEMDSNRLGQALAEKIAVLMDQLRGAEGS